MLKLNKILLALSLALPLSSWAASYYVVVPFKKAATAPAPAAQINVSLSPAVLASAQAGRPYSADLSPMLQVTGDSSFNGAGVAWEVDNGALPPGLGLGADGTISGTPTTAGASSFTVKATYKTKSGLQSYDITSYPAASCKDLLTLSPSTPSGWYTLDVDGAGPTAEKSYYCDMASDGGGWTRVVRQTEAAPVTNWNGGVNGQSYALAQNELPTHTQIGFGKDESATFIDYVNGTYQATDMASVATLTSPKTGFQYQMYHHVGNFYRFNNPEEEFYQYPTNNNPFGDGDWRNALTFDKTGSRAFTWSFAPQHATPAARGFSFNGAALASTSESYAWTVWVR